MRQTLTNPTTPWHRLPSRERGLRAALFIGLAILGPVLSECRRGVVDGAVPDAVVAEAPWEQAFSPDEFDRTIEGKLLTPKTLGQDAEFVPFPGARIELLVPRPDGHAPFTKVAETVSGEGGRYSVGKAPSGAFVVRASHEGCVTTSGGMGILEPGVLPIDPGVSHPFGIQKSRHLTGIVVDRSGKPVPSAEVRAESIMCATVTKTGADGRFAFEVAADAVTLKVQDPAWDLVTEVVPYTPDAPQEDVRIVTAPVDPLSGVVVAAEDGRPVSGALITWDLDPMKRTRSDANGRFSLGVPRLGRLEVLAAGHAWRTFEIRRAGEMELRVAPAKSLKGRVVDADGKPVEGARLYAVAMSLRGYLERAVGPLSAADGSFDFSWLPAPPRGSDVPVAVVAWHRKRGNSVPVLLPAEGPVTITVAGMRTVEGVVLDARGGPVADVHAWAEWKLPGITDPMAVALRVPLRRDDATDASGRFRIPHVPLGIEAVVRVEHIGLKLERILGPSDLAKEGVKFSIPAGKAVRGRVVTAAGTGPGVPGTVTLRLLDVPGVVVERVVESAPDGAFEATDLPAGRYHVRASVPGFDLDGGGEARPGEAPVELLVERSGRIEARLLFASDEDRAAAATASLVAFADPLSTPGLPPTRIVVGAPDGAGDRSAVSGRLAPGKWALRVEGGPWRGRVESFEVGDGAIVNLDVPVERTSRFVGVLRDAAGAPLAGESVLFLPVSEPGAPFVQAKSDEAGRIDTTGLRPGEWTVKAAPRDRAPIAVRVSIPAEGETDLRLPASAEIQILVRLPDGTPATDAEVSLADDQGREAFAWWRDSVSLVSRARVGDDGRLVFRGVAAGTYSLTAAIAGRKLAPVRVAVSPPAAASVVIE